MRSHCIGSNGELLDINFYVSYKLNWLQNIIIVDLPLRRWDTIGLCPCAVPEATYASNCRVQGGFVNDNCCRQMENNWLKLPSVHVKR